MNTKIPDIQFPSIYTKTNFIDEELVSLKIFFKNEIILSPAYNNETDIYVRKSVAEKLKIALSYLQKEYTFKVYDGFRSFETQTQLWNDFFNTFISKGYNDEEAKEKTKEFVSEPSLKNQPVHCTGGAIDLMLYNKKLNIDCNMGCEFDEFTERSHSNYYEQFENQTDFKEIINNRRILYNSMIKAGFTNLPTEIWHYDYGDRFWSYYTKNKIIFNVI